MDFLNPATYLTIVHDLLTLDTVCTKIFKCMYDKSLHNNQMALININQGQ